MPLKSYEDVKKSIEEKGCQLVSTKYLGSKEPLRIIMKCGHEVTITLQYFNSSIVSYLCSDCSMNARSERFREFSSIEELRKYIEIKGCELLSNEYQNSNTIVKIKMKCGHTVEIKFCSFKSSNKTYLCLRCAYNSRMTGNKDKAIEILNKYGCQFISASTEIVGEKTVITYINNCGHELKINYRTLKTYKGQPKCRTCDNINRRIDDDTIKQIVSEKGCELINIEHKNNMTIIEYKGECGCIVKERLSNFKNKKHGNCNKHGYKTIYNIGMVKQYFEKYGCTLITDIYIDTSQILEYIASCGHKYTSTFQNFKNSKQKKCNNCINLLKYTMDDVIEFFNNRGCKLLTNNYINAAQELKYIAKCGHETTGTFTEFKQFNGLYCDDCRKSKSTGEKIICDYLKKNNIKYIDEKTFENCKYINDLRFDFYIPDKNLLIEFDGNHHFYYKKIFSDDAKKIKYNTIYKKDMIKNLFCYKNNIKLIRISYNNLKNLDDVLDNNINTNNLFTFIGKEYDDVRELLNMLTV